MKLKLQILTVATVFCVITPAVCIADDVKGMLDKVNSLVSEENYTKALEELSWVSKEIEKKNLEHLKSFFPSEIEGYKGADFSPSSVMGITKMERRYVKGSTGVKFILTAMGSAPNNPMAAFGGMGQMAAAMGNQPGVETMRIAGRTAMLETKGSKKQLTVVLDGGSMLKLEGEPAVTDSDLRALVEAVDVDKLESYLRGKS